MTFESETVPAFRFRLKAAVHAAGFRTNRELCTAVGVDEAEFSRIVRGWSFPGPRLQKKLADTLGITIRELREFL